MTSPLSERARKKLRVARRMTADGIGVIALKRRSKQPDPRYCPNGSHDATTDLDQIRSWLTDDDRINLAGVMLGTHYLVVDVDGPEGVKAAKELGPLPTTLTTKTPNGTHRFYRHGGKVKGSRIRLATELDIIASGYVLLPESDHPDGGSYESADWAQPIAILPAKTVAAINLATKATSSGGDAGKDGADKIAKGRRDNALTSIAGAVRRQGYGENVIMSVLQAVNRDHCNPSLPEKDVARISRSIVRYAPEHEGLFEVLSNVTPRKVRFLWAPYLVHGAVNLWEGDPDVGKTFVLCAIAAALSSGTPLPGQGKVHAQNVLFMSAEDDAETTLVPRMMRMGADLSRIWAMTKFVRLDEDVIQLIELHIDEHKVRVIMLDPLLAFMQGGIDMNKANETRPFMARLAELAKSKDVTIIALRHLNKSPKDKAIFRGLGSIDITAAARSAVMIGLHPEDSEMRVLTHSKHNLSERGVSLLYTLEGHDRAKGIVPKLVWRGESDLTAEDLVSKPNSPGRPDDASKDAEVFLLRALANGPRRIKDIVRDAERRSIAYRTLRTVRQKMGVIKEGQTWKMAETPA